MANLQTGPAQGLEQLTSYGDPFLSPARLAPWLGAVERQVCQVLVRSIPLVYGTGFLIAPDLVLTCYHVVKGLWESGVSRVAVQVRFDYREVGEGEPADEDGLWIDLDETWQIPHAQASKADDALQGEPELHELDFAVLKLARPIGLENIPGTGVKRGWIDLSQEPPAPAAPIIIVQHPSMGQYPPQAPVKLAIGNDPVRLNDNGTRVSYATSTMPGSSGAPVFDRSLRAIALHHRSGEPKADGSGSVLNNRGIPLRAIRAALPQEVKDQLTPPPARPAATRLPPLSPPVADFTGRTADIEKLLKHLRAAGATGPVAGIRGMGGIGKTQLALAVAQQLQEQYPDQLMFELQPGSTPLAPDAILGRVIHAFQPELKLPDDGGELQRLYRGTLAGKRGLLVLDNALDSKQVKLLLPPPAGWAVLITSRPRFQLPGGCLHDVDLLSPDEAVSLLHRMLSDGGRYDLDGADLAPLAERCGRLPLALRLAASYLTTTDRPMQTYLKDLERARLKYLKDPEGEQSVRAVLGLSVDRLGREAGGLARRWRDLAVFPAPFDTRAAAAVWQLSEEDAQEALDALRQQSLVECDAGAYSLHDLLAEIALEEPLSDEVRHRHAAHYLARAREAEKLYLAGGQGVIDGLKIFDMCLPHLLHAWRWLQASDIPAALEWLSDFPVSVAGVLSLRVKPAQRITLLQRTAEAAGKLGHRRGEVAALGGLGNAYADLGQAERAIEYYELVLAISGEIGARPSGQSTERSAEWTRARRDEGVVLNNLGLAYAALGQTERAIAYSEQALAIGREIREASIERSAEWTWARRFESAVLDNLGSQYLVLRQAGRAVDLYRQALAISQETGDRDGEGADLSSLGRAYVVLGQVALAIDCHEQALAISRAIRDRRGEGTALGNLGAAYKALGQVNRAIEHYEQGLAISREIEDRRMEGTWLDSLGDAHAALGQAGRAIEYCEQALAISREIGDRRMEGGALGNLGLAYAALGQAGRAIEYYEQALAISREIGDRNAEAVVTWNLGLLYEQRGDYARAATLMQMRVDFFQEISHPAAKESAARVAEVRRKAGEQKAFGSPDRVPEPFNSDALVGLVRAALADSKQKPAAIAALRAVTQSESASPTYQAFAIELFRVLSGDRDPDDLTQGLPDDLAFLLRELLATL